jgi:imidazolonepropionase-like amidohydrolase
VLAALIALLTSIPQADSVTVFRNARVLDVRTGTAQTAQTIVVENGRIRARGGTVVVPGQARVIDGSGLTLLPGLMDAHVHLTLAGQPADNALRTVQAGFTSVADLGSAGGGAVRLKSSITAGSVIGPNIIAAGSWIGGRSGVCEFGGSTIRGAAEAARVADADVKAGAELLKLCITNWLRVTTAFPDSIELTTEEINTVAARRLPMAAHALNRAGVAAALSANVKLLAHTPVVDSVTASTLAQRRICVATTMTTLLRADSTGELRQSFSRLRRAGVPMVLGTDAGVLPHGRNAEELVTLVSLGMTPLQALQSATIVPAQCFGLESAFDLRDGATADIIAVRGDPLQDISTLRAPVVVLRSGKLVRWDR